MPIPKRDLEMLVEIAVRNLELEPLEVKILVGELMRKFSGLGLDSFKERIVLSAFIMYPENENSRTDYIKGLMNKLRSNTRKHP